MQKKRNIIVLIAILFAILILTAERGMADGSIYHEPCTQAEVKNYQCSQYGEFVVRVATSVDECSDDDSSTCTTFTYTLGLVDPGGGDTDKGVVMRMVESDCSPSSASFNLIIEKSFENLIIVDEGDNGLDCSGPGAGWNCNYQWDLFSDSDTLEVEVIGVVDVAPSDWIIKLSPCPDGPYGILLAPALSCRPEVISHTAEEYTYTNADGDTYSVTVNKDMEGNIISIIRTFNGEPEDITGTGVLIKDFEIGYPDENAPDGIRYEPLTFIPNHVVTKTGEDSSCAYFYRGRYYNFCY